MAAAPAAPEEAVDRERTCPMLVRVFLRVGAHNTIAEDYGATPAAGALPSDELRTYAWPDSTLRELADVIKFERPDVRRTRCQLSFAIVYPDKLGRHSMKEVVTASVVRLVFSRVAR